MLRVLDFLPDDYVERQRARRANVTCLLMAGGCLVVIGLVAGITMIRAAGTAAVRATIEKQYEQASLRIKDLEQLQKHKQDLLHKADLSAALLERVPRSHILARLTNHLPTETSLTSLKMQVEKVAIASPAAEVPEAPKAKGAKGKKAGPVRTEDRLRFRLDGLAQTDVQVAEYISRLGTDPLFDAVDLQFSEEFPHREGMTMRRFQLLFLLSRDAEKTLEGVPDKAPADVPGKAPAPPQAAATAKTGEEQS
ncbi:MAG: PilN domain-containing protein [Phycisphaerae bacterium]|nr:PilN domain-containing protein [Phycisphaerae bacterium]